MLFRAYSLKTIQYILSLRVGALSYHNYDSNMYEHYFGETELSRERIKRCLMQWNAFSPCWKASSIYLIFVSDFTPPIAWLHIRALEKRRKAYRSKKMGVFTISPVRSVRPDLQSVRGTPGRTDAEACNPGTTCPNGVSILFGNCPKISNQDHSRCCLIPVSKIKKKP